MCTKEDLIDNASSILAIVKPIGINRAGAYAGTPQPSSAGMSANYGLASAQFSLEGRKRNAANTHPADLGKIGDDRFSIGRGKQQRQTNA